MSKQGTKAVSIICGVVALILICGAAFYKSGFKIDKTVYIYIDNDDNLDSVRSKVVSTCNPQIPASFDAFATVLSLNEELRTGKYEISPDISMFSLLRNIRNHYQVPVKLVIGSGTRTNEDIAGKLSRNIMLDSTAIVSLLNDEGKLEKYGYNVNTIPALFIPNTYEVWWDMSIEGLMERMIKENNNFWNEERTAKLKEVSEYSGTQFTKERLITMASIVDSETANNGEKPTIAALYLNRLKIHMPLQSDPTVKYALKEFGLRRILHEHLEVESPYNTYKKQGLPPGPICIPSISTIDAVLNHAHNDYIYMCAKEDFSGTHNFAVSYNEHLKNAKRYTDALNKRNIH